MGTQQLVGIEGRIHDLGHVSKGSNESQASANDRAECLSQLLETEKMERKYADGCIKQQLGVIEDRIQDLGHVKKDITELAADVDDRATNLSELLHAEGKERKYSDGCIKQQLGEIENRMQQLGNVKQELNVLRADVEGACQIMNHRATSLFELLQTEEQERKAADADMKHQFGEMEVQLQGLAKSLLGESGEEREVSGLGKVAPPASSWFSFS